MKGEVNIGMTEITKKSKMAVSRRKVLKGSAAAAGVAIGTGALSGFPTIWAQEKITIRTVGSGVTHIEPWQKQMEKDLGVKIEMTALGFDGIQNKVLTQPKSFDIAEPACNQMKRIWQSPAAKLQPIDIKRLKHWDSAIGMYKKGMKTWPDARIGDGVHPASVMYTSSAKKNSKFTDVGSSDYLTILPTVHNADTLGYRRDLVGYEIDTWAEMLNPKWRGKVCLQAFPDICMMDLAMAIEAKGIMKYGNKGNMTKEEIDKTFVILNDLKKQGHFRAFWTTFMESVNFMTSGEAVIQSMWSPAVTLVQTQGIDVVYADLKEGYRGWTIGMVIPAHLKGKKLDAVYDVLNWQWDGFAGALFGRQGYYTGTPENTRKFMSADEYGYWMEGKPTKEGITSPFGGPLAKPGGVRDGGSYKNRMGNIAVWNSEMDEFGYLVKKWNKFQAA